MFHAYIKLISEKKDIDIDSAVLVAKFAFPNEVDYKRAISALFKDKAANFRAMEGIVSEIRDPQLQSEIVGIVYNDNKAALEKFAAAVINPKFQGVVLNRIFDLYAQDGNRAGMERVALLYKDTDAHISAMARTYAAQAAARNEPAMARLIFGMRGAPRKQAAYLKEIMQPMEKEAKKAFITAYANELRKIFADLIKENTDGARELIHEILNTFTEVSSLVEVTKDFSPLDPAFHMYVLKTLIEGQEFDKVSCHFSGSKGE